HTSRWYRGSLQPRHRGCRNSILLSNRRCLPRCPPRCPSPPPLVTVCWNCGGQQNCNPSTIESMTPMNHLSRHRSFHFHRSATRKIGTQPLLRCRTHKLERPPPNNNKQ